MSFQNCMANATRDGDITPEQSIYVRDLFDAHYAEAVKTMSPEAADAAAARQTYDQMKADAAHSKRVKLLTAMRFTALSEDLAKYPTIGGALRPGKALQALVERDNASTFPSLVYYQRSGGLLAVAMLCTVPRSDSRRVLERNPRTSACRLTAYQSPFSGWLTISPNRVYIDH